MFFFVFCFSSILVSAFLTLSTYCTEDVLCVYGQKRGGGENGEGLLTHCCCMEGTFMPHLCMCFMLPQECLAKLIQRESLTIPYVSRLLSALHQQVTAALFPPSLLLVDPNLGKPEPPGERLCKS